MRDMKELKGTYLQLTSRPFYETQDVNSYFHIILTDEEDVMDALGKLRMIYPNLMKLSMTMRESVPSHGMMRLRRWKGNGRKKWWKIS